VGFIAVVEDVQDNGEIMIALLRKGHQVKWFSSGRTFLAAATKTIFDVVVLDITLNDMHGFEVYRRLREVHPNVPVIVVTRDSATSADAMELGFCECIMKPIVDTEPLMAMVLNHSGGRQYSADENRNDSAA
jgi:DNA-binding NtrC family response regulator